MRSSVRLLILAAASTASVGEAQRTAPGRPVHRDPVDGTTLPSPRSAISAPPLSSPEMVEAAPGYDAVGRAVVLAQGAGIAARHASLPPGSAAEVTALDTGRTVLLRIEGVPAGAGEIALTPGAAALLGVANRAPVRVRAAVASPADATALAAGRAASPRMDAPVPLLAALRRKLGAVSTPASPIRATAPVPRAPPTPAPAPARPAPAVSGFQVQVAAVSSEARARQIAAALGGSVEHAGNYWRVRLGPFADVQAARRARDGAARWGYADAQIVH